MRIEVLSGERINAALLDLARLRIAVFEAFPYLYRGDLEYEKSYLEALVNAEHSIIVTASNEQGEIVGCSTGSALDSSHDAFSQPLRDAGYDLSQTFYCAESVLLDGYRGAGVGHRFFDEREAHARRHGYRQAVFCSVIRPEDHPLKPVGYQPLDGFWEKRGYRRAPGVTCGFEWLDIDKDAPDEKRMSYWMRDL